MVWAGAGAATQTSNGGRHDEPSRSTRPRSRPMTPMRPGRRSPKPNRCRSDARAARARRQQHDAGRPPGSGARRRCHSKSGDKLWARSGSRNPEARKTAVRAGAAIPRGHHPRGLLLGRHGAHHPELRRCRCGGRGRRGARPAIFYALILPFSIGNAVQWTRQADPGGRHRSAARPGPPSRRVSSACSASS